MMQPDSFNAETLVKMERGWKRSSGEEEKHDFTTLVLAEGLLCLLDREQNACRAFIPSSAQTHATSKRVNLS